MEGVALVWCHLTFYFSIFIINLSIATSGVWSYSNLWTVRQAYSLLCIVNFVICSFGDPNIYQTSEYRLHSITDDSVSSSNTRPVYIPTIWNSDFKKLKQGGWPFRQPFKCWAGSQMIVRFKRATKLKLLKKVIQSTTEYRTNPVFEWYILDGPGHPNTGLKKCTENDHSKTGSSGFRMFTVHIYFI
jgi:hypothetical protein